MNKYKTEIFWYEPDQEFVARVVDVPLFKGLSGMAETKEEALKILEETIEDVVEHRKKTGKPIPKPNIEVPV